MKNQLQTIVLKLQHCEAYTQTGGQQRYTQPLLLLQYNSMVIRVVAETSITILVVEKIKQLGPGTAALSNPLLFT